MFSPELQRAVREKIPTAAGAFSAVGSWTEVAVATAIATFAHTVTGTFSDYTKLQFKLEST